MAALLLFFEPFCVTAPAAQLLCGDSIKESFVYGLCPWGIQNLVHFLSKEVSERNVTLMIQAAGHYCTVTQHTDLIFQTVTEYMLANRGRGKIRPVKFISVFKIHFIGNADTLPFVYPFGREAGS